MLAYQGLAAWDASGRALPARLQVQGGELRLHVEDTGARYPLVVDPFVEQAKLIASDGALADNFGCSVAISGDTVVVGAPFDNIRANLSQGSAYVFGSGGGWPPASALSKSAQLGIVALLLLGGLLTLRRRGKLHALR